MKSCNKQMYNKCYNDTFSIRTRKPGRGQGGGLVLLSRGWTSPNQGAQLTRGKTQKTIN